MLKNLLISGFVILLSPSLIFSGIDQNTPIIVQNALLQGLSVVEPMSMPFIIDEPPQYEEIEDVLTDGEINEAIEAESVWCSCIQTARTEGLNLPVTADAKDIEPNIFGNIGITAGDGILLSYPEIDIGHIAVILELRENGYYISEGNYQRCKKTQRVIAYDDPRIKGLWRE